MAVIETWFKQNLDKAVQVQTLSGVVFTEDNEGNLVGVRCFQDGAAATLTGTVSGYVIRQDEQTVAITTGTLSGNAASILLPSEALEVPGIAHIIIRLTNGDVRTTLCAIRATVQRSRSDNIIYEDRVIYSIDDMLRQIAACETATNAAGSAATAAGSAATAANTAATAANTAATAASSAASAASTAASAASTQADRAGGVANNWENMTVAIDILSARSAGTISVDYTNHVLSFGIPQGLDGTGSVSTVCGISPDANHNVSLDSLIASSADVISMVNNL